MVLPFACSAMKNVPPVKTKQIRCNICLENQPKTNFVTPYNCDHKWCKECAMNCLAKHCTTRKLDENTVIDEDTCPMCRASIKNDFYDGFGNTNLAGKTGKTLEIHEIAERTFGTPVKNIVNTTQNIDAQNEIGATILLKAVAAGNFELVDYLMKNGANKKLGNVGGENPVSLGTKMCLKARGIM